MLHLIIHILTPPPFLELSCHTQSRTLGCQLAYFASFTFVSSTYLKVDRLDYHQAVAASFMKWVPISAAVVETADPLGLNRDESKKSKKSRKKKVRQQLRQPAIKVNNKSIIKMVRLLYSKWPGLEHQLFRCKIAFFQAMDANNCWHDTELWISKFSWWTKKCLLLAADQMTSFYFSCALL